MDCVLRHPFLLLLALHWILAVPGPVRNLSAVLDRPTGEVILSWRPPLQDAADITQYRIRYQRVWQGDCVPLQTPGPVEVRYEHFSVTTKRLGVRHLHFYQIASET